MTEDIIIDEKNFSEYFREVSKNKPKKGDIIASYRAKASFIDGIMKKDIIDLLQKDNKALSAVKVMQKLGGAIYIDAIRILIEISNDLLNDLTIAEIEKKEYKYTLEYFYYTKSEYIPKDDPHWTILNICNLNEFLDKN